MRIDLTGSGLTTISNNLRRMIRARLHWVDAYKMDSPCICELSEANRRLASAPCLQL